MGVRNVLVKGGHLVSAECGVRNAESRKAVDRLYGADGSEAFEAEFIETSARGTGCRLSSAIAAGLANGRSLPDAVRAAKEFVTSYIASTLPV
jgi:hydroxymethylpyrimidine/phosphomethylpyrimidine kinase